jgi:hypothetical protein
MSNLRAVNEGLKNAPRGTRTNQWVRGEIGYLDGFLFSYRCMHKDLHQRLST